MDDFLDHKLTKEEKAKFLYDRLTKPGELDNRKKLLNYEIEKFKESEAFLRQIDDAVEHKQQTRGSQTMGDVNFDEFQAIRRRKAQDDEEDEDQKEEPATLPEEEEEPDGLAERAGAFAELPEVQLLLCVAILADVAGAAVTAARDDGAPAFLVRAAAAFPGFVNFLYAFELLALATAFKLRMLTHPGLLLDVGIVSARLRRPLFGSGASMAL